MGAWGKGEACQLQPLPWCPREWDRQEHGPQAAPHWCPVPQFSSPLTLQACQPPLTLSSVCQPGWVSHWLDQPCRKLPPAGSEEAGVAMSLLDGQLGRAMTLGCYGHSFVFPKVHSSAASAGPDCTQVSECECVCACECVFPCPQWLTLWSVTQDYLSCPPGLGDPKGDHFCPLSVGS